MPTFDAKKVVVTVAGIAITGFPEGSKVTAERDADAWQKTIGTDGDVARAKSNNRGGAITISLLQTSLSNDYLTGLAALDELSNAGVVPVLVKDLAGTTLAFAPEAWIKKLPGIDAQTTVGARQWIFDTGNLNLVVGGNL